MASRVTFEVPVWLNFWQGRRKCSVVYLVRPICWCLVIYYQEIVILFFGTWTGCGNPNNGLSCGPLKWVSAFSFQMKESGHSQSLQSLTLSTNQTSLCSKESESQNFQTASKNHQQQAVTVRYDHLYSTLSRFHILPNGLFWPIFIRYTFTVMAGISSHPRKKKISLVLNLGQKTTLGSLFSPATMWAELRSSGLVAGVSHTL